MKLRENLDLINNNIINIFRHKLLSIKLLSDIYVKVVKITITKLKLQNLFVNFLFFFFFICKKIDYFSQYLRDTLAIWNFYYFLQILLFLNCNFDDCLNEISQYQLNLLQKL